MDYINNKPNLYFSEKGQVLLSVVVAVTVALAVGVSISTRTLSMSSRVSRADTSSRLVAAVEGGAERFLVMDDCDLADLADSNDYATVCPNNNMTVDSDGIGCVIPYQHQGLDAIDTQAIVSVEKFNYNNPQGSTGSHYRFTMVKDQLKELPLYDSGGQYGGSQVEICWDNDNAALYYIAYNENGGFTRGGYYPVAFLGINGEVPGDVMAGFDSASSVNRDGFYWCGTIDLTEINGANLYGLRVKSLYEGGNYGVYPVTSDLPDQGYKIISVGELSEEAEEKTVRVISVYRSFPYLPDVMDYAIFTNGSF